MAATPPVCDFGWNAPNFTLPATDGKNYDFGSIAGPKGALIMFICNHCPYVLAIVDRMVKDAAQLQQIGIGVAAICSNDATRYPQDGFGPMSDFAKLHGFTFPYLHDEDQTVARAYDAVCTPDFFGFNADFGLQYRGRLDAARPGGDAMGMRRELFEAMKLISETGTGPQDQIPSMGCSIKWKSAA